VAIDDRVFTSYLALYREAIDATTYAELDDLQPPPFANLAFGGAGTAYALLRLGDRPQALAWLDGAARDARANAYFDRDRMRGDPPPSSSLMFGTLGVHWVRALVEPGAASAFEHALADTRDANPEYASGAAGALTSCLLLGDEIGSTTSTAIADARAAALLDSLAVRRRASWHAVDATRFAHGWSGAIHALLAWHGRRGRAIPGALVDAARALLAAWDPGAALAPLGSSWCNGAGGAALVWTKAFALTADPSFADAARRALRIALDGQILGNTLCCGRTGVAFAALHLDAVLPREGWREHARACAAAAIEQPEMEWPNGLFHGHPGLVCLAQDCLADVPRGFPAVEAI
jgi:hypothetical protein